MTRPCRLSNAQPQTHREQSAARAAAAALPIPTRGRRTSRHACQPPRHVRPPRPSPRCCSGSRAPTPRRPRRPGGGRLGGRGRRRTSDEDAPPPPRLTATALRALRYTARAPNPLFLQQLGLPLGSIFVIVFVLPLQLHMTLSLISSARTSVPAQHVHSTYFSALDCHECLCLLDCSWPRGS